MKNVYTVFTAVASAVLLSACGQNTVVIDPKSVIDPGPVIKPDLSSEPAVDSDGSVPVYHKPDFSFKQNNTDERGAANIVGIIGSAEQSPKEGGERLSYTLNNVYSRDKYYSVCISGAKCEDQTAYPAEDTTYIDGVLYGDFRLELYSRGECISELKINVPRDDEFLILESASEKLSYGCTVLSNKKMYSADDYPDIIQLDFYIHNELEVPQYARYFAVFDGEIRELPVYSNGAEVSPYGTHLLMRDKGYMVQYLTVSDYENPGEYTILKYEYYFDPENQCLYRRRSPFYGWD